MRQSRCADLPDHRDARPRGRLLVHAVLLGACRVACPRRLRCRRRPPLPRGGRRPWTCPSSGIPSRAAGVRLRPDRRAGRREQGHAADLPGRRRARHHRRRRRHVRRRRRADLRRPAQLARHRQLAAAPGRPRRTVRLHHLPRHPRDPRRTVRQRLRPVHLVQERQHRRRQRGTLGARHPRVRRRPHRLPAIRGQPRDRSPPRPRPRAVPRPRAPGARRCSSRPSACTAAWPTRGRSSTAGPMPGAPASTTIRLPRNRHKRPDPPAPSRR